MGIRINVTRLIPGLKIESTSKSGVPGAVELAVAVGRLPFFFLDGGGPKLEFSDTLTRINVPYRRNHL